MTRATRISLAVGFLCFTALAASASGGGEPSGAGQTLRFALAGNPDTLDPHASSGTLTFQAIRGFYDTLVEPGQDGAILPALAESWDISDDGLTWVFHLRPGVLFHNGDPLTSSDVKATLERLTSPETNSGKAGEFASISAIRTPDPLTVVFDLSEPTAALLSSLASGWAAILPGGLIGSGHDFSRYPVGTGPFVFGEWVQDSRIVMDRNPNYWMSGLPMVDRVVISIIPENTVMVQGLLSGDLDAVESVAAQDLPLLRENPEISVRTGLSTLVEVLAMNTARAPLNDVAVRRAVAQAIDKQAVMEIAYGGGEVVSTFMDYGNPYYVDFSDELPYDPDAARASLQRAGYDSSRPLTMRVPEIYEAHVKAAEMYQEMLESVGMNVELQLVDWSTWLGEVYRGARDYDFTVIGHTGKLDPSGRLGSTADTAYGSGTTYVQWVNPTAAEAIGQAARTTDFGERKQLYAIALGEMAREVPQVYVGTNYRYLATRSNVVGLRQDPQLDTFDFRYVEIRK